MVTRRPLDGLRVFELFNDKIALARDDVAAQPGASHLPDVLRDTRFPLHKHVQIAGIEHEQACSREGNNGRGSARPTQHRDLAEEMADAKTDVLAVEIDVDLAAGDEVHRMSVVAAANDDFACLDRLRSTSRSATRKY